MKGRGRQVRGGVRAWRGRGGKGEKRRVGKKEKLKVTQLPCI